MAAAVTAAETGHLDLLDLAHQQCCQTIDRIIDTFPGGQRIKYDFNSLLHLRDLFPASYSRISGGLIPSYELLINNKAVANLIREAPHDLIP